MRRLSSAVLLSLVLAGCGDLCMQEEATFNALNAKTVNCPDTGIKITYSRSSCQLHETQCTPDETARIQAWLDCIDALPECSPGIAQSVFTDEFKKCGSQLGTISSSCGGMR